MTAIPTQPAGPRPVPRLRRGVAPVAAVKESWFSIRDVRLTLSYVALLVYIFVIISFKLNIADYSALAALVGLLFIGHIRIGSPLVIFGVFIAWALLGSMQSFRPDAAVAAVYLEAKIILLMLVTMNAIREWGQLRWFLLTWLGTFGMFGLGMSLYFYATGIRHAGRAVGYASYSNSNDLAALNLLALGIAFGVAHAANRDKLVRYAAAAAGCMMIMLILLTQSRGGLLAIGLVFAPMMAMRAIKNPRMMLYAGVIGAVLAWQAPQSAWDRLLGLKNFDTSGDMREVDEEGSAAQRWQLAKIAVQMAGDNPMFGVGFGNFGTAIGMRYDATLAGKDTHSTYLNVLAETGVPGLVIYLTLLGAVVQTSRKGMRRFRQLAQDGDPNAMNMVYVIRWMLAGLLAYQVASMFGTNIRVNYPFIYMGALWAAANLDSARGVVAARRGRGRVRAAVNQRRAIARV